MFRICLALVAALAVSACETPEDLLEAPEPIGEFFLGHNVVVAPNLVKGPVSREVENEEWIAAVQNAVDARFRRYDGDQLYHFGVSLEGYVLAQPGVPLVLSPKSVLIIKLTVWDDAAQEKLNEPEQITILENVDGDSVIGSGLTKSAEEQMQDLSFNAAKLIENYIKKQHAENDWFATRPETAERQAKEKAEAADAGGDDETTPDASDLVRPRARGISADLQTLENAATAASNDASDTAATGIISATN